MIKVNLISKKRRSYTGRNWTKIVTYSLFGIIGLYFIVASLYVFVSIIVIRGKIKNASNESLKISQVMLDNNDKLSRFVLTKLILTKIQDINKERIPYKDYLDEISKLLPEETYLSSVDFTKKGWIGVSVNSPDTFQLSAFEKTLLLKDTWLNNKFFLGVYSTGVTRSSNNIYLIKLQFELKKS